MDTLDFKNLTKSQAIDSGLAFILIVLLIQAFFIHANFLIVSAIVILIITMSVPLILKPFAIIWFGLSNMLALIVSKIILGVIFYGFITIFARIVLLLKKDPMNRQDYKKSSKSVFIPRNITFSKEDLENAY